MSRARKTGNIVSGVGHFVLIGWILFGGVFTSRPDPVEVQEVAMISGEEFQAMVDASRQPVEVAETPTPAAPEVTEDAPEVDAAPEEPAAAPIPEVAEPAEEPVEEVAPEVSQAAPELPQPPAEVTVEDAPVEETPVERPAEVVAPEPAPRPEPETVQEPTPQEAVVPEETGETVEQPQEAAETPEATDRIVTEAAQPPASAPNASMRPPARRPSAPRPTQTTQAPATPSQEESTVDDAAVQAALEAALSSAATDVPTGPPMSSGEKDALRLAVQNCWNVDPGARWAQTTVTIAMSMTQDGKVVSSSLRMIASEGGDASTANAAFGAARRAILLCQKEGYPLPQEKYGQWKEIEMTFNPERMRIR
ncbi:energy transducer TonB [Sulfitobacter sp. F26169L]|uniref:energy transducer TonB n=1 Tax=Sulfitobacter sp. F26169L TaxID=2996015 RepID=UPI002260FA7A|nr:energy transducer TonB [Sulfitobacter sp. F26169L]MCX7567573.1 energy transducer TonB [Sulfitobacter sp. F26169L]